jgi:hypothetical protein
MNFKKSPQVSDAPPVALDKKENNQCPRCSVSLSPTEEWFICRIPNNRDLKHCPQNVHSSNYALLMYKNMRNISHVQFCSYHCMIEFTYGMSRTQATILSSMHKISFRRLYRYRVHQAKKESSRLNRFYHSFEVQNIFEMYIDLFNLYFNDF